MTTPIEDRAKWKIHRAAMDKARSAGACFMCANEIGFAATNTPPTVAQVCAKCHRLGVDGSIEPQRTTEAA